MIGQMFELRRVKGRGKCVALMAGECVCDPNVHDECVVRSVCVLMEWIRGASGSVGL